MTENVSSTSSETNLHDTLAGIAADAISAGGDTSHYISQGTGYHQHDANWRWTGPATGGDWSDAANWTLYDSKGNPIPSSEIPTGGGRAIPQSEQNADVNVGYYGDQTPNVVVANAPYYNQLRSLSVWQNSTLKITAQYQNGDSRGYVFATAGLENYGSIIVDTSAEVELGGVNVQAGTLTIINNQGNVVFDNDQINNGGTINLINASLGTASNPVTVSGGTVNLQQNSSILANLRGEGGTINVDPDSINTIYINDKYAYNDGNKQNTVINGVSGNTHFGILGTSSKPVSADYTLNSDGSYELTVQLTDGHSFTYPDINMVSGYTPPAHISIVQDGTTGWVLEDTSISACFLAGCMIRTSEGDVAVKDIQIGDQLVKFDWKHNREVTHPVVWVGKAHAMVRVGLPDDEAGYPVRILKDAVADGVPYKDMLITAEHCLFFEGRFVPVRMLVNGVSIFYDKSITSYDYYHVETEQHSVIMADGMLTESYLDTGNRRAFRQEGKVATLRGAVQSWVEDAGAPLCVDRAFVEPLFHKLEARENSVTGCQMPTEQAVVVADPNLHLVTQAGAIIRPMRHEGQRYSFMLPANTQSVRIVSRASRPADVIGPFVDDRRQMGVAVADVHFITVKKLHPITAHLQAQKLEGWHDTDWTDCAWTNGNAVLPMGDFTKGNMGLLSLTIRAAGPYVEHKADQQAQVLSA